MRAFLLSLFLCYLSLANAQQHLFFKPDNLKHLPSSECYNVMQDRLGYIWFSTEAGLCRYNGDSVEVFGSVQGLPEGATYNILEDANGKLWITTSKNRILYYDRGNNYFVEAPFSKDFEKLSQDRLEQIYLARASVDNELWLCTQYKTFKVNLATNKILRAYPPGKDCYYFVAENGMFLPMKNADHELMDNRIIKTKEILLCFKRGKQEVRIVTPSTGLHPPGSRILTNTNKKGEYFFSFENFVVKINSDLSWKIKDMGYYVLGLYSDRDDGLWVCTYKGGLKYFQDAMSVDSEINDLTGISVSGVCEDTEGGIWCTTLEKGMLYSRSKSVLNYANIPGFDKKAELLRTINGRLFTSTEKNVLFEFRQNTISRHDLSVPFELGLADITWLHNNWILAAKTFVLKFDSNFSAATKVLHDKKKTDVGFSQLTGDRNNVYGVQRGTVYKLNAKVATEIVPRISAPTNCILLTSNAGLLVGCKDGLYKVDTATYSVHKVGGLDEHVSRMIQTADKKIWIATRDSGIYTVENDRAVNASGLWGLQSYRITDLAEDLTGSIWLTSNKGVVRVKNPNGPAEVSVFTSNHGLNSDEAFRIAVLQNRVYVSTYDGLCSFPADKDLSNRTAPRIYIRKTWINHLPANLSGNPSLPANENNLRVAFDVLTFKHATGTARLFYTIDGPVRSSQYAEGHELLFNNLAPGKYSIEVFAVNDDKKMSDHPVVLRFEIEPPFWQTPFFIVLIGVALLIVIFLTTTQIINRIRKREEEKTRINKLLAESQMSALRAQMNPHFIFNCINSIQKYILSHQTDAAYNYLSTFSKLIRLVLNYAEENQVSLAQELEIVELYIGLEQLRFEEAFRYDIRIDEGVDTNEVMVPVMIMQPYIENAIWHGLSNMDKGKTGQLHVSIRMKQNLLLIVIEDNGVGLEKSAIVRNKNHKSKATQINNRRTEILNMLSTDKNGGVTIENIVDHEGSVKGTRVTIAIPQNNHYDE